MRLEYASAGVSMIRVTTSYEGEVPTLAVEGELVGEASLVLEHEGLIHLHARGGLELHLSDVTLLDAGGVQALKRLQRRGARITRCSPLIADLLGGCSDA